MQYRLVLLFLLVSIQFSLAQIIESAPMSNPTLANRASELNPNVRGSGDTLYLPFMDDFSNIDYRPFFLNWCDDDVYINTTFAVNPPTVGVATFDGLDATGAPYGGNATGDTLTSKNFYLGGLTESDEVYLSFYYQPKGMGDRPLRRDSFILEYKRSDDAWVTIKNWEGLAPQSPTDYVPDFKFVTFKLAEEYLYNGFQFRFRNLTSGTGQIDLWHLDYVRLTKGFVPVEEFDDVAFVQIPNTFLKNYTSMPWRQYKNYEEAETRSDYELTLTNLFGETKPLQNRILSITEGTQGVNLMNTDYLSENEQPIPNGDIPVGEYTVNQAINGEAFDRFIEKMKTAFTDVKNRLVFSTYFTYAQSDQNGSYLSTILNDIVLRVTIFDNYLAYDDGTAESNVKAQNAGTDIAVKYHLNVADTIRAISMHIPHVAGDASNQLFNLKVYKDLEEDPIYVANFVSPDYVNRFTSDTLQGFTTYVLKNELGDPAPIALSAGDFYVGWEQVTNTQTPVPVGFDKTNPQASVHNFYDAGHGWKPFPSALQGAIMIRPVLSGNSPVYNTAVEEPIAAKAVFAIYPNPVQEVLHIDVKEGGIFAGDIHVYNVAGQRVLTSNYTSNLAVDGLPEGVYFLEIIEQGTAKRYFEKVMVKH